MTATAAANGILRIASTAMSYAVKAVTTERGLDIGDFAMVAYGGAGPLHATTIAKELGIRRVIIPRAPGVFSAFGMLFSDLRYDYVRSWFERLEKASFDDMERIYGEIEGQGRAAIDASSVHPQEVAIARSADMRYVGQEHAVAVDLPMDLFKNKDRDGIKKAFDDMHMLRYGTNAPNERAEIVSLRSTITGVMRKPPHEKIETGKSTPPDDAFTGTRPVFFTETNDFVETKTYARTGLIAGNEIAGPALIEEHASTTVVLPGDKLTVDPFGNLMIAVGAPVKAG
jgi:N-methylhydantoinase A